MSTDGVDGHPVLDKMARQLGLFLHAYQRLQHILDEDVEKTCRSTVAIDQIPEEVRSNHLIWQWYSTEVRKRLGIIQKAILKEYDTGLLSNFSDVYPQRRIGDASVFLWDAIVYENLLVDEERSLFIQQAEKDNSSFMGVDPRLPFIYNFESEEHLSLWTLPHHRTGGHRLVVVIAIDVWSQNSRRWIEKIKQLCSPAVPIPLYPLFTCHEAPVLNDDNQLIIYSETCFQLAPTITKDVFDGLIAKFHGLPAQRLIRWLAQTAFEACTREGVLERDGYQVITHRNGQCDFTIYRGKEGLGLSVYPSSTPRDHGATFDALQALVHIRVAIDAEDYQRRSNLVMQLERVGRTITFSLDPAWSPGFISRMTDTADRLLVPVLSLPVLPQDCRALHPRLVALDGLAVSHLSEGSRDLATVGGVMIPWRQLAEKVEINETYWRNALDLWQETKRWKRESGDRWRLGDDPTLTGARALLEEAGALRERRSRSAMRRNIGKK